MTERLEVFDGKRRRRYGVVAFGVLWLCMTAFFSYAAGRSYISQLYASHSYRRVEATGVGSEVRQARDGTAAHTHYSPHITYSYVVAGRTYEADRYHFMGDGVDFHEAHAIAERHQPGTQFVAFYDPSNPHDAVLNADAPSLGFPALVLFLFWGVGVLVIVVGIRGREIEKAQTYEVTATRTF